MISDDFEEPNDENIFGQTKEADDNIFGDDDDVPTLLDSVKNLGDSREIPLTDEDDEPNREEKLERKFMKVRQQALETGGNPLSPEEKRNFEAGPKFTRNFGTTGKRGNTGIGFGRF